MVQVWHFGEASAASPAQSVPEAEVGRFITDMAYVVLAPPAEGSEGQQRLYLWAGDDAPQDTQSVADKHADELMKTLEATCVRQQQGQETDEFKQLFTEFAVVEAAPPAAAADPSTEAVPPQVGPNAAAQGGDAEGEEEGAHEEDGAGGGAAGGKKKKRRSKKKGPQHDAAGTEVPGSPCKVDSPTKAQPMSPTSVPTSPMAAPVSPLAAPVSPTAVPVSPSGRSMLHADAKPFMPSKELLEAVSPRAAQAAQRSPRAATPRAAAAALAAASPKAASPAVAPAASAPAAEPAAPKADATQLSVDDSAPESVAKTKQQLMSKLSGSLTDPLGEKQQQKAGAAANGKPNTTFMAESAKAWGGVSAGAPAAPSADAGAGEAKVKPGEKTFDYAELKALRVESGIDMTCKEAYLSDAEFEKVFGKDRAAFKALPAWRQQMAKKQVGLF